MSPPASQIAMQTRHCWLAYTSTIEDLQYAVSRENVLLLPRFQNEKDRFKVWLTNAGAQQVGINSLEHQLRDASFIGDHILRLLVELEQLLIHSHDLIKRRVASWSRQTDDTETDTEQGRDGFGNNDDSEDDDDDALSDLHLPPTELDQMIAHIEAIVNSLVSLNLTVSDPVPYDRITDEYYPGTMSFYETSGSSGVRDAYPHMAAAISELLGNSLARRIAYLDSRRAQYSQRQVNENRQRRMAQHSHGRDDENRPRRRVGYSAREADDADAISYFLLLREGDGPDSSSGESPESSEFEDDTIQIPPRPRQESLGRWPLARPEKEKPFRCNICYMVVVVRTDAEWRKHVYADIQPYTCLEIGCAASSRDFTTRRQWIAHMEQHHWQLYPCPMESCSSIFPDLASCEDHMASSHWLAVQESSLERWVERAARITKRITDFSCPFCREYSASSEWYRDHVGKHSVQLAIAMLPNFNGDDGLTIPLALPSRQTSDMAANQMTGGAR